MDYCSVAVNYYIGIIAVEEGEFIIALGRFIVKVILKLVGLEFDSFKVASKG